MIYVVLFDPVLLRRLYMIYVVMFDPVLIAEALHDLCCFV